MTEAEQVMKRCQIGTRNYNEANNLHADCYRVIGKLLAEHAMREVQRLGQEIEQKIGCVNHDCDQCKAQPERLAELGWQEIDCPICGGGARAFPKPEQEPVAHTTGHCENHKQKGGCQLHNLQCGWPDCDRKSITTPPQRTWVGLTEQDLDYLCNLAYTGDEEFALAVQAKLMEKNA
jgi:hypothetical protein